MSNKIATMVFTLGEDMSPIILKVEGALYEDEVVSILENIKKTYPTEVNDNWMQGKVVVYEATEELEGENNLEFEYEDVFLH